MKAVLIAVVGLLAINVIQAQSSCPTPDYTEDLVPTCLSNLRVQLPCYSDPSSYYLCTSGKPVLTKCKAATPMFSYVYQDCTTCAQYIPAVECSAIKGVTCKPMGTVPTAAPGSSTVAPSTTPSGSTATPTVTTPKPTTTTPFPGPPVDTTPSGGSSTSSTGTTINVPGPPGPNDPDVPAPPTPAPTVGTIATGPPEA